MKIGDPTKLDEERKALLEALVGANYRPDETPLKKSRHRAPASAPLLEIAA